MLRDASTGGATGSGAQRRGVAVWRGLALGERERWAAGAATLTGLGGTAHGTAFGFGKTSFFGSGSRHGGIFFFFGSGSGSRQGGSREWRRF